MDRRRRRLYDLLASGSFPHSRSDVATCLKLGTRGSALALWQAERVSELIRDHHPGIEIERVVIRTRAEDFPDRPVETLGVGVFTTEIDAALLRGEIDLAVHSSKDMPSRLPDGLALAALPERESPLDALIAPKGRRLDDLPRGARIGTGSPRRKAQILVRRPDLEVVPIRGNVDTRLRKLREDGLDATVLAHAGLRRLGREDVITELLAADVVTPAVGQGAVAVLSREEDRSTRKILSAIENAASRRSVESERSFLRELRGGCQVPAGALGSLDGERLRIEGVIASPDGGRCVRGVRSGDARHGVELGRELAIELLERGGEKILRSLRGEVS